MDADKTPRKKKRKPHMNATNYMEQILLYSHLSTISETIQDKRDIRFIASRSMGEI